MSESSEDFLALRTFDTVVKRIHGPRMLSPDLDEKGWKYKSA